ncbi:MAG: hypothetical protein FJ087_04810 [Deltaproteobacteria bacterium]|nr:hypothetical protein [Deltaproteobacteria bacterium]
MDEVREHIGEIVPALGRALLDGSYRPGLIRRVRIPKASGGQRGLGIPNVVDRVVQQAVHQVLSPNYEPAFHGSSHGFRPGRSCHTAITEARGHLEEGFEWVVDLDLEKFFDRVNSAEHRSPETPTRIRACTRTPADAPIRRLEDVRVLGWLPLSPPGTKANKSGRAKRPGRLARQPKASCSRPGEIRGLLLTRHAKATISHQKGVSGVGLSRGNRDHRRGPSRDRPGTPGGQGLRVREGRRG